MRLVNLISGLICLMTVGITQNVNAGKLNSKIKFCDMTWFVGRKAPNKTAKNEIGADAKSVSFSLSEEQEELNSYILSSPVSLKSNKEYEISFIVEAEKAGKIAVIYRTAVPSYKTLGLCQTIKIKPGINTFNKTFTTQSLDSEMKPSIVLAFGKISGKIKVSDFKISPAVPITMSILSDKWQIDYNGQNKEVTADNGFINIRKHFGRGAWKKPAVLTNTFTSNRAGNMRLGVSSDWWMEIYGNGKKLLSTMDRGNPSQVQSSKVLFVDIPMVLGKNELKVKVCTGSKGWSFTYGEPVKTMLIEAGEIWKKSVPIVTTIVPGSALDLSQTVTAPEINQEGVVVYNEKKGNLTYAGQPEKRMQLFSCESMPFLLLGKESLDNNWESFKKQADLWALSLKQRGYRNVRMHNWDSWVCKRSTNNRQIHPETLKRLHYCIYALKKNGIRLQVTILAYGLYNNAEWAKIAHKSRSSHKVNFIFLNGYECEAFEFGVKAVLETVNPFTGLALKDDPVLYLVEFYNETEVGVNIISSIYKHSDETRKLIDSEWQAFLKKRNLPSQPIEFVSLRNTNNTKGESLYLQFLGEQLDRCFAWAESVVRKTGYQGLTVQNSQSKFLVYGASKWRTAKAVETHTYYGHPSRFEKMGSKVIQRSSVEELATHFRSVASVRQSGRGLEVGEYNHVFRNKYVHEGGVVFPAFSAFQGFNSISHFSNPYLCKSKPDKPIYLASFTIAGNPVMMANGFLGAVLFGRADVKASRHLIRLDIGNDYLNSGSNAFYLINTQITKIALMTGFAIAFPDQPMAGGTTNPVKPDLIVKPTTPGEINYLEWASSMRDVDDGSFDLVAFTQKMREKGILDKDNISDPAKGIFQSDTNEITINGPEKWMTIITPKTEVVSLPDDKSMRLKQLSVINSSTNATVAVSAVDGKTLADSSQIVLIYSTPYANAGMETSMDQVTLYSLGRIEPLGRTGKLEAEFKVYNGDWELYALGLDGERLEKLPVTYADGKLKIIINTASLKYGVTPFFELIKK